MSFYRPPTIQSAVDSLGSIYRALRAWRFYPKGHPLRKTTVRLAHSAMTCMLDGNNFSLVVSRSGFSLPDGEKINDSSNLCPSLSYQLFIRRAQKITFLHELFQEDLLEFIRILALNHDEIQQMGGMEKIMEERGIRTIWLNEFDLHAIFARRNEVEKRGVFPQGLEDAETGPAQNDVDAQPEPDKDSNPAGDLAHVLGRLSIENDPDIYMTLVRRAVSCADSLQSQGDLPPVYPLVELLAQHSSAPERAGKLAECALIGLEHLSTSGRLLNEILDNFGSNGISEKAAASLLRAAGPPAVALLVDKLEKTDNFPARKMMLKFMVAIGESAISPILAHMDDPRWYIVRNIASVLGEIGSREALPDLLKCLRHKDVRVSKEAIRSLAKIGGKEAESAVIEIIQNRNDALLPQAIASAGGMKSRRALPELLKILSESDMLLNNMQIKMDALAAIAMIGDRQAAPPLAALLDKSHMLARSRWEQLNTAIASCLGKLAYEDALPLLRKKSKDSGLLGKACAEAIEMIERSAAEHHGRP